jgi:hypothetical protein
MPKSLRFHYYFSINKLQLHSLNASPVFVTLIKHSGRKNSSSDRGFVLLDCAFGLLRQSISPELAMAISPVLAMVVI